MGARETALNALIACRKEGAWSNGVLKSYIQRDRLDSRDAALATRLCYGVLQNRNRLDYDLDQLLTGKRKNLHPVVRDILHLGLYQIYEMDKIPDSAAVNEAVTLTKKYGKNPNGAALVNAVLRNAARNREARKVPVSYAERYSHPEELIRLLKENLPKGKLEPMLMADNAAPQTMVQVNTLRISADELVLRLEQEGVRAEKHGWMPDCFVLSGTGNLEQLATFRDGFFYVQDPAAKLSVLCAGLPKNGAKVLDCCSAPGGKSFAAAIAMGGNGQIFSCDVHKHKTELIENGAKRLKIGTITVRLQDATQLVPEWVGAMDAVIADVPCSGLGIIRKKPDIRYKNLEEMQKLPELQLAILNNQAQYVHPGGVLMYSTCTVLKRENEDVVRAFLDANPAFCTEKLPLPDAFAGDDTGMLTLIPGEYDTDGFFICRLRRKA